MLVTFLQIAVTLVIAGLIVFIVKNTLQKKRNQHLEEEVEEVSKKHDQLLAAVLQPYHDSSDRIKLTRGKTRERYEEISEGFLSILHAAKEAQQNLDGLRVTRASYGSILAVLPRATAQLDDEFEKLNQFKKELEELEGEDQKVSSIQSDEKKHIQKIESDIVSLQEKTGYPLTNITQKSKYLKKQFEEITEQIGQLDFVSGMEELERLKEARQDTVQRLTKLKELIRQSDLVLLESSNPATEDSERFLAALKAGEVDRADHYYKKLSQYNWN
ncbi:hypothetical protein [Alkalicoccobacillus murimartini]|uniref:Chromosome segregation ATPase n=1 Tax=Alkalicoccobacillus murimartini TaxID=171685 RepID=A0ABT9YBU8_9BACI|nr:hypothetical protein [Alkalicoccobacillus murimartini]MDQ0205292.1 chromosome segregation ATPase [Alkalicoccobacillus murimartini]